MDKTSKEDKNRLLARLIESVQKVDETWERSEMASVILPIKGECPVATMYRYWTVTIF